MVDANLHLTAGGNDSHPAGQTQAHDACFLGEVEQESGTEDESHCRHSKAVGLIDDHRSGYQWQAITVHARSHVVAN
jgi:hypothetical protein